MSGHWRWAARSLHLPALACAVALGACADRWLEPPSDVLADCAAGTFFDRTTGRCVRALCTADDDCPGGLRCDRVEQLCVERAPDEEDPGDEPAACRDGTRRCAASGERQRCEAGAWVAYPCPGNTDCDAGTCQPCSFGERRCHEDRAATVEVCNAEGTWTSIACTVPGASCEAGQCTVCQPNEGICIGAAVAVCSADGTRWETSPCDAGERCAEEGDGALCVPTVCHPQEQSCVPGDPSVHRVCTVDGSRLVEKPCPTGTSCRGAGECLNACELAAADGLGVGCEYWFTQLPTGVDMPTEEKQPLLAVTNADERAVVIHLLASDREEALVSGVVLGAGSTIELPLPVSQRLGSTIRDAAFQLLATGPVSARLATRIAGRTLDRCACVAGGCASDDPCIQSGGDGAATTLLPLHLLGAAGSDYVAWSPRHQLAPTVRPGLVAVVATRDRTEVEIDFSTPTAPGTGAGAIPGYAAGERGTFTLDAGQVLQLATAAKGVPIEVEEAGFSRLEYPAAHFGGTVIRSSAPVAVFAGADGHRIPLAGGSDPVLEQLPQRAAWSQNYAGLVEDGSDWFELVAEESTTVAFSATIRNEDGNEINLMSLPARSVRRFRAEGDFRFTAGRPVLLVRLGSGAPGGGANAILPPPPANWRSVHQLRIPAGGATIGIVAPSRDEDGEETTVRIAGVPVDGWKRVGTTMKSARVPLCAGGAGVCVPTGTYVVEASAPILVEVVERGGWGIAYTGDRGPDPMGAQAD